MATEIIFTKEALDTMSELQLEALVLVNERFETAARCKVYRDFSVDGDKPWLVSVFEWNPRINGDNRNELQIQPFVIGISPEGDTHS